MRNVYEESESLDKRCYETYALSPEILMEHAALGLVKAVKKKLTCKERIVVICGTGNNGADGIAAARLLFPDYNVTLFMPHPPKSELAKIQLKRAHAVGVPCVNHLLEADLYIDALFGSGLTRALDAQSRALIDALNAQKAYVITCDIPSGLMRNTSLISSIVKADETICMGALKTMLLHDFAKDVVGKIRVVNLGISPSLYERASDTFLLQKKDLKLPFRQNKNTNKGSFGHVAIVQGEKEGASLLAAMAAFHFGAGLVSIIGHKSKRSPAYLMFTQTLPQNATALVAGMGLEGEFDEQALQTMLLKTSLPLVIDASLCYHPMIVPLLNTQKPLVLTPHPKEFSAILALTCNMTVSVEEIQRNRFTYAKAFCAQFPHCVLVLKGANTIIAHHNELYINTYGSAALSKGGSGDVLAGMIGSLIAQGYTIKDAAIQGSLAHTLVAQKIKCNNYALTPIDLCKGLKWL